MEILSHCFANPPQHFFADQAAKRADYRPKGILEFKISGAVVKVIKISINETGMVLVEMILRKKLVN